MLVRRLGWPGSYHHNINVDHHIIDDHDNYDGTVYDYDHRTGVVERGEDRGAAVHPEPW